MSDQDLALLLERAAEEFPVGQAPLDAVHILAGRRYRGRRAVVAVVTSAATVAAVIAATVAVVPHGNHQPSSTHEPQTRLFGLGHVAVEVPSSWVGVRASCLAPLRDAVIFDDGSSGRMDCIYQKRPAKVETIGLRRYYGDAQPSGSVKLVIDDHEVYGTRIACDTNQPDRSFQCSTQVFVPAEHVLIRLSSSTSRARILEMRDWIRILPNRIAVPLPGATMNGRSGANYQHLLASQGLKAVKKVNFSAAGPTGQITRIFPAPGTVLKPGSTVQFTVSSQLHSASHNVRLSFSVANPQAPSFTLKDATIRVAGYATTALGARLTLFIKGADHNRKQIHVHTNDRYLQATTIRGAVPRGVSAYAWTPIAIGRTTLTIYVTDHGRQVTVGYVVLRILKSL